MTISLFSLLHVGTISLPTTVPIFLSNRKEPPRAHPKAVGFMGMFGRAAVIGDRLRFDRKSGTAVGSEIVPK